MPQYVSGKFRIHLLFSEKPRETAQLGLPSLAIPSGLDGIQIFADCVVRTQIAEQKKNPTQIAI